MCSGSRYGPLSMNFIASSPSLIYIWILTGKFSSDLISLNSSRSDNGEPASCNWVQPILAVLYKPSLKAFFSSARVLFGIIDSTNNEALSINTPLGSPLISLSIFPPMGLGVFLSMPANFIARLFTIIA